MKQSIYLKKAILLALLAFHGTAFAGGNVENGGDAVMEGTTLYSLDLVERGVEKTPYIGETLVPSDEVQSLANKLLGKSVDDSALKILKGKLERIKLKYNLSLWVPIKKVMETYELVLINAPLKVIPDSGSPIDDRVIVRMASHSPDSNTILMNQNGLKQMDAANQAALLLHELIYASTMDKTSRTSRAINVRLFQDLYAQDSLNTRYWTTRMRIYGEACFDRHNKKPHGDDDDEDSSGKNLICDDDYSVPAIIFKAGLVEEYAKAYAQAIPAETVKRAKSSYLAFLPFLNAGPKFLGDYYYIVFIGKGKFTLARVDDQDMSMLADKDVIPLSGGVNSWEEHGYQIGPIDFSSDIWSGLATAKKNSDKTKMSIHGIKLPNGKFVYALSMDGSFEMKEEGKPATIEEFQLWELGDLLDASPVK